VDISRFLVSFSARSGCKSRAIDVPNEFGAHSRGGAQHARGSFVGRARAARDLHELQNG
jgi:hypothetical protein